MGSIPTKAASSPHARWLEAGLLFIIVVTLLVARLVSLLVVIFLEVPLLGVVPIMRLVILAVAHTHPIVFVFRIIPVVSLLLG